MISNDSQAFNWVKFDHLLTGNGSGGRVGSQNRKEKGRPRKLNCRSAIWWQCYKTFFSSLQTMRPNKLECLYLVITFPSSLTFAGNTRSLPKKEASERSSN